MPRSRIAPAPVGALDLFVAETALVALALVVPEVPVAVPTMAYQFAALRVDPDGTLWTDQGDGREPALIPAAHRARVTALCGLRDQVRTVLAAELAGAPDGQLTALRGALRAAYDAFRATWGPINLENVSGRGTRYPNLAHFTTDPDFALVAALETVDCEDQRYEPAAIFTQRVVRTGTTETVPTTPSDALAVSLDRFGRVNLDAMSAWLNLPIPAVVRALGDQLYQDPTTLQYELAGLYLSGDIRAKLAKAEQAATTNPRYARNVTALAAVTPADLSPEEIQASLGSPWIPASDVAAFVGHLLGEANVAEVTVEAAEARWTVALTRAHPALGVRARQVWGTEAMPADQLVEALCNQQPVKVFATIRREGKDVRVLDVTETVAAREKAEAIRREFSTWLWQDATRATRLAGTYNARYNAVRLPVFDGSHLTFPGLAQSFTPYPHQRNAIWRGIVSGRLLECAPVGGGKSFIELGIALELRRLGMARKPCLTVPNHLVMQMARECATLYPMARLIVVSADATADERARTMARVSTGDWDVVLMPHSVFSRIPVSVTARRVLAQDELAVATQDEPAPARRRRRQEGVYRDHVQLTRLWNGRVEALETATDPALTWEMLGCDALIVDESHAFKNGDVSSKNREIARDAAVKSLDLYYKTRLIDRQTPGRGVYFATGTPVANALSELHVFQRYLQRDRLLALGLYHFDAWCAMYAETVTAFEIAPGGGFRQHSRLASFKNVPEMLSTFREVADFHDLDTLGLTLPTLVGGAPETVSVAATDAQRVFFQDLAARATTAQRRHRRLARAEQDAPARPHQPRRALRRGGERDVVNDNILAILNDGRRAAVDMRLVQAEATEQDSAKLSTCADRVGGIWRATEAARGTQMVFCDLSTPHRDGRWNVYDGLRSLLEARGIPAHEIAYIHDATTDRARARLFAAVREGRIRVLIGSTEKMGAGTNVQDRLCAVHHLDAGWRPADMQQRNGRMIRPANIWREVRVLYYVTEGSFDAYVFQTLERKGRFVAQVLRGDTTIRTLHDMDEMTLSFAAVKAIATGDPRMMEKAQIENELARVERLHSVEARQRWSAQQQLADLPGLVAHAEQRARDAAQDRATVAAHPVDGFALTTTAAALTDRTEAGTLIAAALQSVVRDGGMRVIGRVRGMSVIAERGGRTGGQLLLGIQGALRYDAEVPWTVNSAVGLTRRVDTLLDHIVVTDTESQDRCARLAREQNELTQLLAAPNRFTAPMAALQERLAVIDRALGLTGADAVLAA